MIAPSFEFPVTAEIAAEVGAAMEKAAPNCGRERGLGASSCPEHTEIAQALGGSRGALLEKGSERHSHGISLSCSNRRCHFKRSSLE